VPVHVLIIEDDPALLEAVREHLVGRGHRVDTARTGREGLAAVARQHPQVVLLDLTLPDLDGAEVLRQILRLDRRLSVIIVSGSLDMRRARQLRRDGAFEYIVKPFELAHLDRMIAAAVGRAILGTNRPPPAATPDAD
jgi:DNA-binding NtrC family response regulator